MNTRADVEGFLSQGAIAAVGVSRDPKAFSVMAYRELKGKGKRVYPVNPNARTIGEDACYPSIAEVPEKVGAVLVLTPPAQSAGVVQEAARRGIRHVWLQQGTVSGEALALCEREKLSAVAGKCIMMFAEPVASFHGVHRWFARVFGQIPRA